jgi:hypothetical protein
MTPPPLDFLAYLEGFAAENSSGLPPRRITIEAAHVAAGV